MDFQVLCVMVICLTLTAAAGLAQDSRNESSELKVLQLVAMVSEEASGTRTTQDWERGLEILPGAHVAVQEVNRNTDILPGYQLELVEIIAEGCSGSLALADLAQHLIRSIEAVNEEKGEKERQTVGIIGPLCDKAAELVAELAEHPGISLVQIATSQTTLNVNRNPEHAFQFQMLPLSRAYINTVLKALMVGLGWSRISVLCSHEQDDFNGGCKVAEAFVTEASMHGIEILFLAEISYQTTPSVLTNLQESGAKIILAFLPPSTAVRLLCAAYNRGVVWPEYGWLLPGLEAENLETGSHMGACDGSVMAFVTEGVFLPQFGYYELDHTAISQFHQNAELSDTKNSSDAWKQTALQANEYASIFYDSVWAFALALNRSIPVLQSRLQTTKMLAETITNALLNLSFTGDSGYIEFASNHYRRYVAIDIKQMRAGVSILVGEYDPLANTVIFNASLFGELPSDELETVYTFLALPLAVLFGIAIVFGIFFNTFLLLLYFLYRKEPEIKATGIQLTMLMFLGCYLVLIGNLILTVTASLVVNGGFIRVASCEIFMSFSLVGIDMFIATLIARMLRVYRVFTHFGRTGRFYSNRVLLLVILCTVGGKILILTLWGILDPYQYIDDETYHPDGRPPYFEVNQYCESMHYDLWICIAAAYTATLLIILFILAVKTRKVSKENFKDTKKVNLTLLVLLVLWTIFPILNHITSDPNLNFIFGEIPMLLTVFSHVTLFFVSKITAPMSRSLRKWLPKKIQEKSNLHHAAQSMTQSSLIP